MTTSIQQRERVTLPGVPDNVVIGVIPAGQLVELGILVDVPILDMPMHDERTGCERAHRYLAGELQGTASDFDGCHFYQGGRCSMNGKRANPCLFHEPESGRSWDKVKWWCLLEYPNGSIAITPRHSAMEISQADGARVVSWEVVRV